MSAWSPTTLKEHSISARGQIQPSVIRRHPGCDFQEFVMLDSWSHRRAAQTALPH
jgi:hypothetical protein